MADARLWQLDGLRGASIAAVIVGHFFGPTFLAPLGVDLFFAISGYIVARLLLEEGGRLDLVGFYGRRLKRLGPALLGLMLVLLIIFRSGVDWREPVSALTFWANYLSADLSLTGRTFEMPIQPLWSLGVEAHFYLVLPLVILAVRGSPIRLMAGAAATCVAVLLLRGLFALDRPDLYATNFFYTRTEFRIDALAFGVLAACAAAMGQRRAPLWMLPLLGVAALLPLDFAQVAIRPTIISAGAGIAVFAAVHDDRLARPIAVLRPFVGLGLISYSLYLWHLPALQFVESRGWDVWAAIPCALVLATLSYALLERRSWRWRPPRSEARSRREPALR